MVKIGRVWEETTDALSGRLGSIAPVAVLALFLPGFLQLAAGTYLLGSLPADATTARVVGSVLSLAILVLTAWGQLTIMAIATDPATTRGEAQRQASARLLPAIGVLVLLLVLMAVLALPIVAALGSSGFDFAAASAAQVDRAAMPTMPPGTAAFVGLYGIAFILVCIWLAARLAVLVPVILNERQGARAITRALRLSAGMTLKLIGLFLLFGIVVVVASYAARAIIGIVFRLLLGEDGIATALFLAAVAGAVVSTGFMVVAHVFTARLYVALRADRDGADFAGGAPA